MISHITPGQCGAQKGNRTLDLFITSEMLYRLSYLGAVDECNERVAELSAKCAVPMRPQRYLE